MAGTTAAAAKARGVARGACRRDFDDRGRAYALAALQEIETELAATGEGARNTKLYKAAFRLGTMQARGWLSGGEITEGLLRACDTNGFTREHGRRATKKTIESGLHDGGKVPHGDLQDRAEYQPHSECQEARSDQSQKTEQREQRQQRETGGWDEPDGSLIEDRHRGELPEFPAETLGLEWEAWLDRAAHGAGVTPAHVAVPMLAAAAGLIGTARRIQPSRSWSEPLTLWTATVGYSGTGKTPGADVSLRALSLIEASRRTEIAALQAAHETKAEIAKAAKKRWEKEVQEAVDAGKPAPAKPLDALEVGKFIVPRLFASNVTVERWATLLQARPQGMLMYRDELAGHFLNLSRYSNGQDDEFWLESFNGKSYVVERQSAPAIVIPHLLIGLTGGLQPDKLARSFEGDDDGMYGRVLFAWPPQPSYRALTDLVGELEPELVDALTLLASLPSTDPEGNFVAKTVPLTREARETFEHFRHFLHQSLEELAGREREWFAKGPTHVLRLAGTLGYLDWSLRGGPEPQAVDARFMLSAVKLWRGYFWPHARAALRIMGLTDRQADARRVLRWIKANDRHEISLKDARREALGQRLDAEETRTVLGTLERAGWLRLVTTKTPGRTVHRWQVNPELFSLDPNAGSAGSAERG